VQLELYSQPGWGSAVAPVSDSLQPRGSGWDACKQPLGGIISANVPGQPSGRRVSQLLPNPLSGELRRRDDQPSRLLKQNSLNIRS